MKNTFFKKPKKQMFIRIFAVMILAITALSVIQSCEKQHIPADKSKTITSPSGLNIIDTGFPKVQALARLNESFENEFSPITMQQVRGVNKQQFTQWLRNGVMAPAETMFLSPLLNADSIEYLIIKNVTVKANGKKASIGLIATTPKFYTQYTRMVAVINYTNIFTGNKKICSWKKCDSYEACPCITWIDFVTGPDCPSDKCFFNYDCQGYNPAADCDGELTDIKTYDVIAAF